MFRILGKSSFSDLKVTIIRKKKKEIKKNSEFKVRIFKKKKHLKSEFEMKKAKKKRVMILSLRSEFQ